MSGNYTSVSERSEIEIIINKSRFIGRCFPVSMEADALFILEEIRKKHRDATHNCYAYSIDKTVAQRFSDDGEPSGTAGQPMMSVINQRGITNVLVIVTRYFGGIQLGAGGLVRAYTKTTAEAIDAAKPVEMISSFVYEVVLPYNVLSQAESYLTSSGFKLLDKDFSDEVRLRIAIPNDRTDDFTAAISKAAEGKAVAEKIGDGHFRY